MMFSLKALRDSKARAAKDHGIKFRGDLAVYFKRIVHCLKNVNRPFKVAETVAKSLLGLLLTFKSVKHLHAPANKIHYYPV